jgi:S-formylglutathione hydrolase FrmB
MMKKQILFSVLCLAALVASGQPYMKLDASFYSPTLDMVKKVDIYLPGEYYVQPEMEFPVVYYLHGAGGDQNAGSYSAMTYYGNYYSDSTHNGPAAIFVCPDGSCEPYLGSMWLNSELYGNYEDYVINDVIRFVETNFRVVKDKAFRFIHGHSMGGFGSAYLALKHPDLFRASCPSAGMFSAPDTLMNAWRDFLYEENEGFHLDYNAGNRTSLYFTICGGLSPNMSIEPNHFESVYDTLGNKVDTVYEKWNNFACSKMIYNISAENDLAFFLICGVEDEFIFYPTNLEFVDSLQKYNIEYQTAWHNYGHTVFDPVTHKIMFNWLDSLIADAYVHLDVPQNEFNPPVGGQAFNIEVSPNPTLGMFNVQFTMYNLQRVSLKIYDLDGREMAVLVDGKMPAGEQVVTYDASALPAGVYVVRMEAGGQQGVVMIVKY